MGIVRGLLGRGKKDKKDKAAVSAPAAHVAPPSPTSDDAASPDASSSPTDFSEGARSRRAQTSPNVPTSRTTATTARSGATTGRSGFDTGRTAVSTPTLNRELRAVGGTVVKKQRPKADLHASPSAQPLQAAQLFHL